MMMTKMNSSMSYFYLNQPSLVKGRAGTAGMTRHCGSSFKTLMLRPPASVFPRARTSDDQGRGRCLVLQVGEAGFEPTASCSQSRRSNQAELHSGEFHQKPPTGFHWQAVLCDRQDSNLQTCFTCELVSDSGNHLRLRLFVPLSWGG